MGGDIPTDTASPRLGKLLFSEPLRRPRLWLGHSPHAGQAPGMPARPQAAHEVSGQRRRPPRWPPAGRSEPALPPRKPPPGSCFAGEHGVTFSPSWHPWTCWPGLQPRAGTAVQFLPLQSQEIELLNSRSSHRLETQSLPACVTQVSYFTYLSLSFPFCRRDTNPPLRGAKESLGGGILSDSSSEHPLGPGRPVSHWGDPRPLAHPLASEARGRNNSRL